MSSILTNSSAMNALTALRAVNSNLSVTQDRISTGLKVASAKDNAAYFSISETMKSDNNMYMAIDEGLTLTRNAVSTARLGTETVVDFTSQIADRVAFAQSTGVDRAKVQQEINGLVEQVRTTITQATFNGADLVNASQAATGTLAADYAAAPGVFSTLDVVTGVTRAGGTFDTTTITVTGVDLAQIWSNLDALDIVTDDATALTTALQNVEATLSFVTDMATNLGVAERAIENQQEFLSQLTDNIETGVSKMIDADMEEEAARLQSLQVQQQLATQALSIANAAPQNLLGLFR